MRIDSSGNVGIGTTSPATILHISQTNPELRIQGTNGNGGVHKIFSAGVNSESLQLTGASNLLFNADTQFFRSSDEGTEYMRIDSSGNVGIGESSPSHKLHISAAENSTIAYFDTALGGRGLKINTFASGNAASAGVEFEAPAGAAKSAFVFKGASEFMRIDTAGRLLLGASTSAIVGGGGASLYQIETTSQNAISCVAHRGTGNASGSIFILGKSRGTSAGAVTSVGINDELGSLRFAGADDTDLQSRGGEISCEVDGTPGSNDMPGRLLFKTTADGAAAPTECV